jgi:predicted hydrocarbon binding protein
MSEKEVNQVPEEDVMMGVDYYQTILKTWGYDPSTSQFRNEIIFQCADNVFRTLRDTCGSSKMLTVIKPYTIAWGHTVADFTRSSAHLGAIDMMAIALPMQIGWTSVSMRKHKPMRVAKDLAIIEAGDCFQTTLEKPLMPEICQAMCHCIAEGVCQAYDAESEYVFTHHVCYGDNCCRAVIKKKSNKLSLDQLKRLEETFPTGVRGGFQWELGQIESDILMTTNAFNAFNIFTAASVQILGPQRTDELGFPVARRTGKKLGTKLMGGSVGKGDLKAIKEKMDFLNSILAQRGDPAVIDGSSIEKEIEECPFKNGLPEQCKHWEGVFAGVCEAINPEYEFHYDRMMSRGDHSCHWVVKKKSARGAKPQESTQDDSLGY